MKPLLPGFIFFFSILISLPAQNILPYSTQPVKTIPIYTDDDLSRRLKNLTTDMIPPRMNSVVKGYIKTYAVRSRERTERMLGRTVQFFPVFEKYLVENNLPMDLKCLPIVESALNPAAVSRASAVGLWQIMERTGKAFGLRIDRYVDERKDPYRSTEAALTYLEKLYNRFGDWTLALAAYNGGPGRVKRAIRRGGSKDFWRIRRYLPRETRNYVPAFIAALYIWNYYHLHDLEPNYPEIDLQMTAITKVYQGLSFYEIAAMSGISVEMIAELNPSYKHRFIPQSVKGYYLILPQRAMGRFLDVLKRPDQKNAYTYGTSIPAPIQPARAPKDRKGLENYLKTSFTVQKGDNIDKLAKLFNCSVYNIRTWNNLNSFYIREGQELIIYKPKPYKEPMGVAEKIPFANSPKLPEVDRSDDLKALKLEELLLDKENYIYYKVENETSLIELEAKFEGLKVRKLAKWNDIKKDALLRKGQYIIVKKRN